MKKKSSRAAVAANTKTSARTDWIAVLGWILAVEAVGIIGSFVTTPSIPTWYATLVKPSFSPPNWIFGPVWTVLYAMMGIAAYRISRIGIAKKPVRKVMTVFAVHLLVNSAWSFIFFGMRNVPLAFVDIAVLWILILVLIRDFLKLDRVSAYLMVPYLAWVSFASVLNYHIWLLNF